MIILNKEASFPVVENYVRNQLISQIYVDVDFYLAMGNLYTLNIRIGGADMFDSEAVRITKKMTFGTDDDVLGCWVFNIIIKKGYVVDSHIISTLFEYICKFSQYLVTRDHAKDTSEWQEYEKKELR
jgi:hypothetical protein